MSETDSVIRHRQQFSALTGKQYFNYGGQGPMADSAIEAMHQAQIKIQQEGPFSKAIGDWIAIEGEQVRAKIAQVVGAAPKTITLTENVTVGCNIPLWGTDWAAGDHILIGDCEHPGVVATVREISRRHGVAIDTCSLSSWLEGVDPLEVIAKALTAKTRLVILSHILWNTGQLLPLSAVVALCHANSPRTKVLIDAAQSVGSLPLDQPGWTLPETGVDYYAFTGHKWCGGPAGLGGLYIRPEVLADTAPTFIGWRGVEVDGKANPTGWKPDGRRFEVATSDYALWVALQESLGVQAAWGSSQARYDRICELSARLWKGLRSLSNVQCLLKKQAPLSGLVAFQMLDKAGKPDLERHSSLVQQLETEKIYLRTLLSPNCIRACVHYLTTEAEVDCLIERLAN
ncbi:aminotransferase, class V superfamily [Synechococcus sp. PCC 7335]|uniref:aminotransferase class V-fold PLP-dependent enzyme n=1 Tax=Synechococcus sp. (strain ATCC 29403 / PCC 7335) TaxID=91464 RepID=UPI00017EB7FF|nr:aminotransferase class V-fold PLP-dependent enzyme [Synechococcus sp. PCC 7335]EDX87039.1 aminotransferase, class V superfamily [Synechococcus sp. PCC 7335]